MISSINMYLNELSYQMIFNLPVQKQQQLSMVLEITYSQGGSVLQLVTVHSLQPC